MKRFALLLVGLALATFWLPDATAWAGRRARASRWAHRFALTRPWHGDYYYTPWGTPAALVVPPTAHMQTAWSWGVSQTTIRPIYHQYQRTDPGSGGLVPGQFLPTPVWPSHTDQFGVYYVRGPWGATAPRAWRHGHP